MAHLRSAGNLKTASRADGKLSFQVALAEVLGPAVLQHSIRLRIRQDREEHCLADMQYVPYTAITSLTPDTTKNMD